MLEKARIVGHWIWELFAPRELICGESQTTKKVWEKKLKAFYVCERGFLLAFFTKHKRRAFVYKEGFLSLLFFPPSFVRLLAGCRDPSGIECERRLEKRGGVEGEKKRLFHCLVGR